MYFVPHFINGKKIAANKDERHNLYDPATGKIEGQVAYANRDEIEQAVTAAKLAFSEWSKTTPLRRSRILFKFKELIERDFEYLAGLVTAEHGKTIEDAKGSVARGLELVEYCCGIPHLLKGTYSENVGSRVDSYTIRQPLGICAGITPFNFPVMIPLWMFVPAIACGNTFILKPSEKDPSAPLHLALLMQEAGLPDGVLNIVNGAKEVVDTLLSHPDIVTVGCVGSTPVAEAIYKTAISHGKRAQTFGGAKNHCIVMPDANMEDTAEAIASAAYGSAGERCMAISVAVAVGDTVADRLIHLLQHKINHLKVGPGIDPSVHMGPLVTQEHLQKVKHYIESGVNEGAKLIVDGRDFKLENYPNGFFMGASLFDHVKPQMKIYKEEIFGPVLSVVRVANFDAALDLINQNEFGNGTAIFTRDGNTAREFAARVQVGMVGINVPVPVPVPYHAFGGWKRSRFGDTYLHDDESIRFYTKSKSVTSRWV